MSECTFKTNLGEFSEALRAALSGAMVECGLVGQNYAKQECPVDTGNLRSSIEHTTEVSGSEAKAYIGTNVEYAKYVESDETKHHAVGNAHFLKHAASNHSDEYKRIIENALK